MREARLVGLSPDGTKLILAVAETGEEVAVGIDDRLRAAVRGDRARLGQLEIKMDSALRPRDIQARIRAGESPEAVAQVAQMPVDRVMAFAGPVLAERDHIASVAQRAAVRRRGGDGASRNLGTWVTERLRSRAVDPNSAEWDAWRRDDGRWAVRVVYTTDERLRTAMFAYDAPGRYAVPDDDEARWLVGEQATTAPQQPGTRRLAAVNDVAPDHGADSYEAGFEEALAVSRNGRPSVAAEQRPRPVPPPAHEATLLAEVEVEVEAGRAGPRALPTAPSPDEEDTIALGRATPPAEPAPQASPSPHASPSEAAQSDDGEPTKRSGRRGHKRASVPSWDEIMFGKKAD